MNTLHFYYGSLEKNIEITKKVYHSLQVDSYLVIPADDNVRATLFTDPCFKVLKVIMISGLSPTLKVLDHTKPTIIDLRTNQISHDPIQARTLITQTGLSHEQKVKALHPLLTLTGGTMADEFPEQCIAMEFLTGKETVLEIGGNIGRNSMLIATILKDDRNLLTLECSTFIAQQLKHNRDQNQFRFHIENAALSTKKMIQRGWNTTISDEVPEGYTEVPITSYAQLQAKYNLQFDTLVLDCEGSFYYMLQDFPEIMDHVTLVLVENDYATVEQKAFVDARFKEKGLECVYTKEGCNLAKSLNFACVDRFYEVWRKVVNQVLYPITSPVKGAKFMEKYPCILFFRHSQYAAVDSVFDITTDALECSIRITDSIQDLSLLYDVNYPILITYGQSDKEYYEEVYKVLTGRINKRWIHYKDIASVQQFVYSSNFCYIQNVLTDRTSVRPVFSIFTTCYNSYEKIERAYQSIRAQRFLDWEWVILDDSPTEEHFAFLKKKFHLDQKVRLYKRSCNSGNIGNVKNEAVGLCRGQYVLEMDHDDEILPDTLLDATKAFEDKEVGFVYMDFINIYEDGRNFSYSDFICKGYGGYYKQKYNGRWVNVYMTPNVNNITLSHIVCLPNHPRIWRTETLLKMGNYSELLPICDDQEILMRTALQTKMVKIPKLAYVQYMNDGNNNFSLIRNREINRLGPQFIVPQFYNLYQVHDKMKEKGAYEDERYVHQCTQLWKRDSYEHRFCNERIQYDYDMQYCIIGINAFMHHHDEIKEAYRNGRNDFLLLDGTGDKEALCSFLDSLGYTRMKCYSLSDTPPHQLRNYFMQLYVCCHNTKIIE